MMILKVLYLLAKAIDYRPETNNYKLVFPSDFFEVKLYYSWGGDL